MGLSRWRSSTYGWYIVEPFGMAWGWAAAVLFPTAWHARGGEAGISPRRAWNLFGSRAHAIGEVSGWLDRFQLAAGSAALVHGVVLQFFICLGMAAWLRKPPTVSAFAFYALFGAPQPFDLLAVARDPAAQSRVSGWQRHH